MNYTIGLLIFASLAFQISYACIARTQKPDPKIAPFNRTHSLVPKSDIEHLDEDYVQHESIPIWFPIMIAFLLLAAVVVAVWQMMHPYMHRKKLERIAREERKKEGFNKIFGLMVSSTNAHTIAADLFEKAEKEAMQDHVAGWRKTFA